MSRGRWIWIALALLVLARLAVVASIGDVFGYGEEFVKGAAAKAMIDGLPIEHHRLAYGYHEGGGFAVTHLKALLFLVMGPSVLANKVAAILLAAVLMLVVVAFAREHLGHDDEEDRDRTSRRAAWIAATLFVLAPTNFVRFSLLSLGTHFEAQIFTLLVLHFTLRLTRRDTGRSSDAVALGLAGGFGLYFSLTILPALAAAALWIVLRRRGRVFGRETTWAVGGFVVGALPLWIMLSLIGKEAVVVGGHEATTGWSAFCSALGGIPGPILRARDPWVIVHAALFAVAIVWGAVACARRAHALVGATLALYALAYAISGFALAYDPDSKAAWFFLLRLVPFWLAATIFAAHGVSILWDRGGAWARGLAVLVAGVAVLNGARDLWGSCAAGRPSAPLENLAILARTKGYVFAEYFDKMHEHVGGDREDSVRVLGAYHEDPRRLLPALTQSLFDHWKDTPEAAVEYVRGRFGADARFALRGLGRVMHPGWIHDVPAAFARLETMPEDAREPLAEALGRTPLFPYFLERRLNEAVAQEVPERWRAAWLRGCGWRAHHTFPFRPDLADAFVASRPESERAALRAGLEEARETETIGSRAP